MCVLEDDGVTGKIVNMRRGLPRVAIAGEMVCPHRIHGNKNDIGLLSRRVFSLALHRPTPIVSGDKKNAGDEHEYEDRDNCCRGLIENDTATSFQKSGHQGEQKVQADRTGETGTKQ